MASFALELSLAAKRWLSDESDDAVVNLVTAWIEHVLCDDQAAVHDEAEPVPLVGLGHQLWVAQVPGSDIAVTFFVANPFRTIKVMRIESIEDVLGDLDPAPPD